LMRREEGPWIEGSVVELTAADFSEAISRATRPVLVDFWAGWCAPCTAMKPVLEAMAREYAGKVSFAKVNVDRNEGLARRFGVRGIPNFILFKDGRPVDQVVGAVGRRGIETMLRRHLS
ncbi:MAG: thioredoxin, partial [Candidatus Bathyarchaeia archaeon]